MEPLSVTLLTLLDRIHAFLVKGELPPEDLMSELELRWRSERPTDLLGLEALLKSLCVRQDDDLMAEALQRSQNRSDNAKILKDSDRRRGEGEKDASPDAGEQKSKETKGWLCPVYFGTNRVLRNPNSAKPGFTGGRSNTVSYGQCHVLIPSTHRFGETGRPWLKRYIRLEFRDDHLKLKETNLLSEVDFWSSLKKETAQFNGFSQALVFLHGYNVSFTEAAIRAAQLHFDLGVRGATAFFSWPSQGTLTHYPADAAAIEASEEAIAQFLANFARQSGADKVHLIAHSMGNRGLLRALQRLASNAELRAGVKFGQVFLAAPDIDRSLFLSLAELYPQFSERTTLYSSDKDKALAISSWIHKGERAGFFPPVTVAENVQCLDTLVVPDFDVDLFESGHSYFAESEPLLHDIFDLMNHGTPPGSRQRLIRENNYWKFRK